MLLGSCYDISDGCNDALGDCLGVVQQLLCHPMLLWYTRWLLGG